MENNTTPNTPAELLARVQEHNATNYEAFAEFLTQEVLPEFEPSPSQVLHACVRLIASLENYHFDVLQGLDKDAPALHRQVWKDDYKALKKARKLLLTVTED